MVIIKHARCVIFKTTAGRALENGAGHSLYFSRICFFVRAYILYNINVCEYDINIFFFGV